MKTPSNYMDKTCANSLKSQTAGDAAGGPNFLRPITIWHPPEFTTYKPFMPLKFNIIQHFNPMKFHKIPYEIPRNPRVWSHWISELSPSLGAWDGQVHLLYGCHRKWRARWSAKQPTRHRSPWKSGGRVGISWWFYGISWDFMGISWDFMQFWDIVWGYWRDIPLFRFLRVPP